MTENKINLPRISVSTGNIKMGKIPSISLPPIITCSAAACATCGKRLLVYEKRRAGII